MGKQQTAEAISTILEDAFDNATHKTLGGYGADMTSCREMVAESVPKIMELFSVQSPIDAVAHAREFAKWLDSERNKQPAGLWSNKKIWGKETACEIMYSHFNPLAAAPPSFTPDQIENAFYAACNMINRHLGEKAISVETVKKLHKEYMNTNFPNSKI